VQVETIKDLVKPPYANYDVVVYFGCGLFALPFLFHYLGRPADTNLSFNFGLEPPFVATLVTSLALLFSVYILGHIIAYAASQFIEKTMDTYLGKTSTAILLCCENQKSTISAAFRARVGSGFASNFKRPNWLSGSVRTLAHAPLLIAYFVLVGLGVFGYYRTRVSAIVMDAATTKLKALPRGATEIGKDKPWFKALEAAVINNNSAATARMYNYLVISGLFRSVCLILLCSLWFEMAFTVARILGCPTEVGLLMFGAKTLASQFLSYFLMTVVYFFSLFSYLKFQRRYVEDAIFAFVFAKD